MKLLLRDKKENEYSEQELASVSARPGALSIASIVQKKIAEQASLSSEKSDTQIFKTLHQKESQQAGSSHKECDYHKIRVKKITY